MLGEFCPSNPYHTVILVSGQYSPLRAIPLRCLYMSYTLALEPLSPLLDSPQTPKSEACDCASARVLCAPSFVFSIEGQVGFRSALRHLAGCQKRDCRVLRGRVMGSMRSKLSWLMHEECLLGCVHIQPTLYGTKRILLKPAEFPGIATHLSKCPKESCAQLRRSILLRIRDELRPS